MNRAHSPHIVTWPAVLSVVVLALTSPAVAQPVLYVDGDAPPAGNGQAWGSAYRFLQDALADAAASGGAVTEIRVAQGVYTPDRDESNPQGAGECFLPGGAGCPDAGCEAAVCAVLPLCCASAWDQLCVDIAVDECTVARSYTFQLVSGVELLGGYAGNGAPDPDQRDPAGNGSVLSGDLAGNDGPGLFDNNDENAFHVVTGSGTDTTAVLDGFTITAGHANGAAWPELGTSGGGFLSDGGSPTVNDCLFVGNRAEQYGGGLSTVNDAIAMVTNTVFLNNAAGITGGGMDNALGADVDVSNCTFEGNAVSETYPGCGAGLNNFSASPTISNCVFTGNTARDGGGLTNDTQANPTIIDCEFTDNWAAWGAGAMVNVTGSSPTITGCTFSGNVGNIDAGGFGGIAGAIVNWADCSPTITDCRFEQNDAATTGGAIVNNINSSPVITNCEFINNSAANDGGAINNYDNSNPQLVNCLFVGNTAGAWGGGLLDDLGCRSVLTNCTFALNSSDAAGGAVAVSSLGAGAGTPIPTVLTNCVLWGNTAPQGAEIALMNSLSEVSVSHSDVRGGEAAVFVDLGSNLTWGDGNIDANPLFADAGGGDYRLSAGSPAIDAADTTSVPAGVTADLDGSPRLVNDPCREDTGLGGPPVADMGAYEFQNGSCDLDGSGTVGVGDFLDLLAAWGDCPDPCPPSCPADFDGDCTVGVGDFLILLANWG
jgi:hypothetical protein